MNRVPRDVWKLILNYCYRPKKILYAVLDLDILNDGIHQTFPLCETPEEALEISYNDIQSILWKTTGHTVRDGCIPLDITGDMWLSKRDYIALMLRSCDGFVLDEHCIVLQRFELQ